MNLRQYQFLDAIERQDWQGVEDSALQCPPAEECLLYNRGLYTCQFEGDLFYPSTCRLTSMGKIALMCYRAMHMRIGL
jgi:hypothetical protein